MFAQTINVLPFIVLNKRLVLAVAVLAVIALAFVFFVLSPEIALAGPATSPSACGACNGG